MARSPTSCGISWREYRERSDDAEFRVGHERAGDQHAVEHVVETVAGENHLGRCRIARLVARRVHLAGVVVAVPPQDELLQHEERQDAEQQRHADVMRIARSRALERVRQQADQGGREQRARRKTDEVRQHGRTQAIAKHQEEAGREGAQQAAQGREQDDESEGAQARCSGSRCARSSAGLLVLPGRVRLARGPSQSSHASVAMRPVFGLRRNEKNSSRWRLVHQPPP